MMKQRLSILLVAGALCLLTACGGTSDPQPPDPATTQNTPETSQSAGEQVGAGTLGDYHVEIKSAALAEEDGGNPAVIITYTWTNNSKDTSSAMVSFVEKAFQDGVQLDSATIGDSSVYDFDSMLKNVEPGGSLDVQRAYVLKDETSVVTFELTEFLSLSDDVVTMEFDLSAL